jgi:hypothetical protein
VIEETGQSNSRVYDKNESKAEKSFYSKNPYGDISHLDPKLIGKKAKINKDMFVMIQEKQTN